MSKYDFYTVWRSDAGELSESVAVARFRYKKDADALAQTISSSSVEHEQFTLFADLKEYEIVTKQKHYASAIAKLTNEERKALGV